MRFDDLARAAARDLHAESRRVIRPDIGAVDISRRRRTGLLRGGASLVAVGVLFAGGLFWLGGGEREQVAVETPVSTVAVPDPTSPSITIAAGVPDLIRTLTVMLDGSLVEVAAPEEFTLEGYSLYTDVRGYGESFVTISRGDAGSVASEDFGVREVDIDASTSLWRSDIGGEQPLYLAIEMDGFTTWLNIAYGEPDLGVLLDRADRLRERLAGGATDLGVVIRGSAVGPFSAFLSSGEDAGVAVRVGECLRERVTGSEITSDARLGDVVRADTYAAWCLPEFDIEIEVSGPPAFVDDMVEWLTVTRRLPDVSPVTTLPPVPQADLLWERNDIGSQVVTDGELIFVADGFLRDRFTAVRAETGETVWQRSIGDPSGTSFLLAIENGRLLVSGQRGDVVALEAGTGSELWRNDILEDYGAASAVASGGSFIVGTDAATEGDISPPVVYSYDQATGAVVWSVELAVGTDLQWGPPGVGDGMVVFQSTASHEGSASGNLGHALEVESGALRWVVDMGGGQGFWSLPTIVGSERVALYGPTGLVLVDAGTGEIVGRWRGVLPLLASPGDWIFAVTPPGIALFDPETGERDDWVPPQGAPADNLSYFRPIDAQAALRDGEFIITHDKGVTAFDVADGRRLWEWRPDRMLYGRGVIGPNFVVLTTEGAVFVVRRPS